MIEVKKNKILGYISLGRRGGNVVLGADNLFKSKKKVRVIFVAKELSENTLNKIENKYPNIVFKIFTNEELSMVLGVDGVKVVGVTDLNLYKGIEKVLKEENHE